VNKGHLWLRQSLELTTAGGAELIALAAARMMARLSEAGGQRSRIENPLEGGRKDRKIGVDYSEEWHTGRKKGHLRGTVGNIALVELQHELDAHGGDGNNTAWD
jgi:hypothetical protein